MGEGAKTVDQFIAEWTKGFGRMSNQYFALGYREGFCDALLQRKLGIAKPTLSQSAFVSEVDRASGLSRADEEYNDGLKVGFLNGGRATTPVNLEMA